MVTPYLIRQRDARWQNRARFIAMAAQCKRRILVDYARTRHYQKRQGVKIENGNLCYLLLVAGVLPIVTSPIRLVLV